VTRMEPFLPPAQPADNPAQKKKSSALLWWVILIIAFVAIYNVMSPGHEAHGDLWSGLAFILSGWPFLLIGLVIFYLWWQFHGGAQFQLAQEPGLVALAEGQFDDAAAIFRGLAEKHRRQMQYASVARYNLAIVLMRHGKLESAIAELIAVETGAGLLYAADIRRLAAISLGECYALRGDLDTSRRWVDEARKRLGRGQHRNTAACLLRLAEAVLDCRAGRFDEALRGLERDWRQLEGTLALPYMRVGYLMRAYATAQLGGPRGEGAATPFVTLLRGAPLDHLAVEWPELRTFLAAQGLSGG
jgi:tetratricopeptide (TPR) repeat protein